MGKCMGVTTSPPPSAAFSVSNPSLGSANSSMTTMSTTKESGTEASVTDEEYMYTWMVMHILIAKTTLILFSGSKFDGIWENDRINGEGTSWYPNGNRYQGDWSNGRINGRGLSSFPLSNGFDLILFLLRHSVPRQRR
jgi:hypothetical protein